MKLHLSPANLRLIYTGLIILLASLYTQTTYGQTAKVPSTKFAEMGDCLLESNERIQDCVIGYRTVGTLNADSTNAILIPTWLAGTSQEMMALTAPGAMADSTKYFVILVDAFGNGISSSPSNSTLQPLASFPQFTIGDMVDAQYQLITEKLGQDNLYAVIGISMGGMQAFEWMLRYPDFVDVVIPLLGSPRLSGYDRLLWNAELEALKSTGNNWNQGMGTVATIHARNVYRSKYISEMNNNEYQKYIQAIKSSVTSSNAYDWASQLKAMLDHDISRNFERDIQKASLHVKSRVMVVSSKYDNIVDPEPALHFAELIDANMLELTNECGHQAVVCQLDFVNQKVSSFLNN